MNELDEGDEYVRSGLMLPAVLRSQGKKDCSGGKKDGANAKKDSMEGSTRGKKSKESKGKGSASRYVFNI